MNKTWFAAFLCLLLLVTGCSPKEDVKSEQSIQDIVSNQKDFEDVVGENALPEVKEPVVENKTAKPAEVKNETEVVAPVVESETPIINKKCRNSAIVYGGCKWTSTEEISFDLKIQSASKEIITGTWLFYTGESGGVKKVKRTEDLISGGIRTYNINYRDIVKEIGKVKRLEVLPIEIINGTEYSCENQHVYTIPETYCKPAEATKIA